MKTTYIKYGALIIVLLVIGNATYFSFDKNREDSVVAHTETAAVQQEQITENGNSTVRALVNSKKEEKNTTPVVFIQAESVADFSNDRALVGSAHNVFVATVVRQKETDTSKSLSPRTQYEVRVVENIKGSLGGVVTVNQNAAYKDGTLYVLNDDIVRGTKQTQNPLLEPGVTYLFVTRYNVEKDWHNMNLSSYATAIITKEQFSTDRLVVLANENKRVKELRVAYPNEILLQADIKNNNALNSYSSRE